jgi:protein-S-isoprenylcysteine O-methyltransferase Ste14
LDLALQALGLLLIGWGVMFAFGALVTMGRRHAWRNITPFPKPLRGLTLITDGAFAYVRHPHYFGIFLAACGWALYRQNFSQWVIALLLGVFFYYKSMREEKFLQAAYPEYADYSTRVKCLIPGLY